MIDHAQKIAAVDAYIDGFARGDLDTILAIYADDATVEDPVGTPLHVGIEAVRAFYAYSLSTGAKLELMGDPRTAGDYIAFPFRVLLNLEGKDQAIEVIDTFKFNADGKVVEMRAFWGPRNVKAL